MFSDLRVKNETWLSYLRMTIAYFESRGDFSAADSLKTILNHEEA